MSCRVGIIRAFILFLAPLWATAPYAVRAEHPDAAFVEGLRQRKWFDLAQASEKEAFLASRPLIASCM